MNEPMCYVGLRECGCIRAVAVDSPQYKKETAKAVASWMKRGLTIERWTSERVRATDWKCPHTEER